MTEDRHKSLLTEEDVVKYKDCTSTCSIPGIMDYVYNVGNRISDLKKRLIEETRQLFGIQEIMITPEYQAEFIATLVQATGAKKCLEVGVFTGYSSLCIASVLPEGGHLWALDISDVYTQIARKYWTLAGVQDKVTLTLAPALETLQRYVTEGHSNTFDFFYIDADKENDKNYYDFAVQLVRPGGVILIDNVLFFGTVLQYHPRLPQSAADGVRALNVYVHDDQRVSICMLPMSDGLTMAVKR